MKFILNQCVLKSTKGGVGVKTFEKAIESAKEYMTEEDIAFYREFFTKYSAPKSSVYFPKVILVPVLVLIASSSLISLPRRLKTVTLHLAMMIFSIRIAHVGFFPSK